MTLPNFLIIGVEKSGTTALWYYLKQHPDIFMTDKKEPKFFAFENNNFDCKGPGDNKFKKNTVTKFENYINLFKKVTNEKAIGEASPVYFLKKEYAERVRQYIPGAKLILVIRNPVDRAYSSYMHLRRDGRENCNDFEMAISKCEERIYKRYAPIWNYIGGSFYYENIKNYFEIFPKEQIKIYLYDDFKNDNLSVLKNIFNFLEVDENFKPSINSMINDSFIPKSRLLHKVLKKRWNFYKKTNRYMPNKLRKKYINITNHLWENNKLKPKLPEKTKYELIEIFKEDILKTQDLIGKDLSMWL